MAPTSRQAAAQMEDATPADEEKPEETVPAECAWRRRSRWGSFHLRRWRERLVQFPQDHAGAVIFVEEILCDAHCQAAFDVRKSGRAAVAAMPKRRYPPARLKQPFRLIAMQPAGKAFRRLVQTLPLQRLAQARGRQQLHAIHTAGKQGRVMPRTVPLATRRSIVVWIEPWSEASREEITARIVWHSKTARVRRGPPRSSAGLKGFSSARQAPPPKPEKSSPATVAPTSILTASTFAPVARWPSITKRAE